MKYPVVVCPYCGGRAKIVSGDEIYPHRADLRNKPFYRCRPCDAYVGCHPKTVTPIGVLANGPLRTARSAAHHALDTIWKSGTMTRGEAYEWLSEELGISNNECHIGAFDMAICHKVVELCNGIN